MSLVLSARPVRGTQTFILLDLGLRRPLISHDYSAHSIFIRKRVVKIPSSFKRTHISAMIGCVSF